MSHTRKMAPPAPAATKRAAPGGTGCAAEDAPAAKAAPTPARKPVEHGGPAGPEPTRYGDWERNGRCIDF
jgi:hypothetical protein